MMSMVRFMKTECGLYHADDDGDNGDFADAESMSRSVSRSASRQVQSDVMTPIPSKVQNWLMSRPAKPQPQDRLRLPQSKEDLLFLPEPRQDPRHRPSARLCWTQSSLLARPKKTKKSKKYVPKSVYAVESVLFQQGLKPNHRSVV